MKLTTTILVATILFSIIGCSKKHKLEWKVQKAQPIVYIQQTEILKTPPSQSDTAATDLFAKFKEAETMVQNLANEITIYTILQKKDTLLKLSLVQSINQKDSLKENKFNHFFQQKKGAKKIGSFNLDPYGKSLDRYCSQKQKNLLHILFQLPKKYVGVGDKWNLDLKLVTLNGSLIPEKEEYRHQVSLSDIIQKKDTLIAILDYDIFESVEGKATQAFLDKEKDFLYSMEFKGQAQFDISNGKWKSFKGTFTTRNEIITKMHYRQTIELIEVKNAPKDILAQVNTKPSSKFNLIKDLISNSDSSASNTLAQTDVKAATPSNPSKKKCPYIYRIQIASSKIQLQQSSSLFLNTKRKVQETIKSEEVYKYKYSIGEFCSSIKASYLQDSLKKEGFKGCFLVREANKRITN